MLGCTAVVLIIIENIAYVAHIGDSRAYIIQEDNIRKITTDHSYVQVLIDRGELAPEKAILHSKRHVLSRCLGSHQKAKSDYSSISIVENDKSDQENQWESFLSILKNHKNDIFVFFVFQSKPNRLFLRKELYLYSFFLVFFYVLKFLSFFLLFVRSLVLFFFCYFLSLFFCWYCNC